jgi:hypothetical protein
MATEAQLRNALRAVLNEGQGAVPFNARFRRMSNRISALLPAGNPDGTGASGPQRNELLNAIAAAVNRRIAPVEAKLDALLEAQDVPQARLAAFLTDPEPDPPQPDPEEPPAPLTDYELPE